MILTSFINQLIKAHSKISKKGYKHTNKSPQSSGQGHAIPPHMYDMIWVHSGNLATVNDSYGPPIPYMECENLVTVSDSYGPPIPDMECGNLVTVNDSYGLPNTLYGIGIW